MIDAFVESHRILVMMVCGIIYMIFMIFCVSLYRIRSAYDGTRPQILRKLTPTQRFILAASSPTIANNYKCVIDVWGTHQDELGAMRAKELFEWGWGELTYDNVLASVEHCLHNGYNVKYGEYLSGNISSENAALQYTDFERKILAKAKEKYREQGLLGWDLVRVLSVVGGAYMGGAIKYEEAGRIAIDACRLIQKNFSSWDELVGSYTLGYYLWRKEKNNDRLRYYKSQKRLTKIYRIAWDTQLRENEL